jgi:hypothetical protein
VGSVAEGFAFRLAAPAQGDVVFALRDRELIPEVIHDADGSGKNEWAVFTAANDELRHWGQAPVAPITGLCDEKGDRTFAKA